MGLKQWGANDLQASPEEMVILENWEIIGILNFIGRKGVINPIGPSPYKWEPSLAPLYKTKSQWSLQRQYRPGWLRGSNLKLGRETDGDLLGIYREDFQ